MLSESEKPICKRCGSKANVRKKGFWKFDLENGEIQIVQRYHCRKCGYHFNVEQRKSKKPKKHIWDFDVEGTHQK